MNGRELEEMRRETTALALLHINQTPELYEMFTTVRDKHQSLELNSKECLSMAEEWSKAHKDEFGALFRTELELVRWNNVLRDL